MSEPAGNKAILAALGANLGIAAAKFIAWGFSGSASLLAEGIHSLADSGNQVLLFVGRHRAQREADREHPFGYGRERFVFAFVVSIVLFSVGGVFTLYEGYEKLTHPHGIELWWLPMAVLLVAMGLESFSLRTALHESRPHREGISIFRFIHRAKAPELPVVILEDTAALLGLVFAFFGVLLTVLTGDPVWDAIGSLCIGALLITVAIVLGIETKSLLVGEGAGRKDLEAIENAIRDGEETESIIHLKTLYLGPEELLVGAKVAMPAGRSMTDVATAINAIEERVRARVPIARVIYLEPDIYVDPSQSQPATDSIVIRGRE